MTGRADAPGSAGNLGPGFDVLALALELRCSVEADLADSWRIVQDGTVTEPDEGDMVRRAVEAAVGRPMELRIDNAIPRARGLGSSSAVTTAAAAAAVRACGREPRDEDLFDIVTALEGHGDNAAAAVYGGCVVVSDAVIRHLDIHPDLMVIVAIPDEKLPTDHARSVLGATVERWAASRNLARVAFLVEGLRTGDHTTLRAAGGDELHEAPRRHLSPITGDLIGAALDAGAHHAAWSGAGPTAIAFTDAERIGGVEEALKGALHAGGTVRRLNVAARGWR